MLEFLKTYPLRYARWYAAGIVALLATSYLMALIPRKIEAAIDLLADGSSATDEVWHIVLVIIALSVTVLFTRMISRVLIFFPGRFVEFDIRNDLFEKLIGLSYRFYQEHKTGDLMSRAVNDIQHLRLMVGFAFLTFANTAAMFGFAIYQMLSINPELTFYAFTPVPVMLLMILTVVQRYHRAVTKSQQMLGSVSDYVVEAFGGIAVIKSFGAEKSFADSFHEENVAYQDINLRVAKLRSIMFPMLAVLGSIGNFVLFIFGGQMIIDGTLTIGEFTAFSAYIALLAWPTASLAYMISVYQRGKVALKRIQAIMDVVPEMRDGASADPKLRIQQAPTIAVKDLSFRFTETEKPVLENISFSISAGQTLGVFGPTGSGKSVLSQLLARVVRAPEGSIFLDEKPLEHYTLKNYREALSYVPQQAFLFSDSIKENVAYGRTSQDTELDMERVRDCTRRACVDDDIAQFSKGYETVIGEKGIILSGGQRNRLALARSYYKPHSVLILDDILASVDHDTEERMIANFVRDGEPRTTVLVSHRISALVHCDHIIVLEHGRITAQGNHQTLSERDGIYRDTWLYQRLEQSSEVAA